MMMTNIKIEKGILWVSLLLLLIIILLLHHSIITIEDEEEPKAELEIFQSKMAGGIKLL